MIVNRKLLGEMLGRWHTQAKETIDTTIRLADQVRLDAAGREAQFRDEVRRLVDDAEALRETTEVQQHTYGRLLDETRRELAVARARIEELTRSLAVAQNNFEWARVRLNSVEQERAILVDRVLSVRLPVPELSRDTAATDIRPTQAPAREDPLPGLLRSTGLPLSIFDDMGDAEARAQGLSIQDDGTVAAGSDHDDQ